MPANIVPPAISGSAVEGDTLAATSGTWTGSPTVYAYQWQDCDALGMSCLDMSGATASSYRLSAGDLGGAVRVTVTASNASGSSAASSAPSSAVSTAESSRVLVGSPAVQPQADSDSAGLAEAFQYTALGSGTVHSLSLYVNSNSSAPAIDIGLYGDVAGHVGELLASAAISSPADGAWNTVSIPPVAVSSGTVYWLAALAPGGTLALRDVYSGGAPSQNNASRVLSELPSSWSGGSSWMNSPASFYASSSAVEAPPPPPTAPSNTVLPSVSGTAQVGQTLTASDGMWGGSTPMGFGYQWQDCDSSGAGCVDVSGATSVSDTLGSGDVSHTVRAVVTASNAGGSTSASSAASAVVVSASGGGGSASCTATVGSLASVVSLTGSEPDGSTICIADGSYGSLALSAARTGYVTIAAANGPGHVMLSGLTVSSSALHLRIDGVNCACNTLLGAPGSGPNNIQIVRTESEGFQVEAGSDDLLFDHDYSHNGPYGVLLNGSRHPVPGGCCETTNYPFIENVTISNSKVGPVAATGADAFQVKGFKNLTISNNDIYDIYQNGNHNDGVQTVHGGSNLTITHNYFHDGNIELFMIKDGEVEGTNAITENLVVRENSSLNPECGGCSTAVFGQWYSPQNATIANNTIVEPGLSLRSQLSLVGGGNPYYLAPSATNVTHNVIQQFRAEDDETVGKELGLFEPVLTHSYNIFGTETQNNLSAGPGDTFVSTIGNTSSLFKNPSENDFRLASNPNNIGVDWKPSEYHYGP